MIIMIYTPATDMYVPVFFVLLQSKKQTAYYHALQQCICASNWKMEAATYTADFETALYGAMRTQYPEGLPVLCFFHWKQAIRRKLKVIYVCRILKQYYLIITNVLITLFSFHLLTPETWY